MAFHVKLAQSPNVSSPPAGAARAGHSNLRATCWRLLAQAAQINHLNHVLSQLRTDCVQRVAASKYTTFICCQHMLPPCRL